MKNEGNVNSSAEKTDFRAPTAVRKLPRAVADAPNGVIIAVADVAGSPEQIFNALTTSEIERWWKYPGNYFQKDFKAEVSLRGRWS